jgi:hypothetical protein
MGIEYTHTATVALADDDDDDNDDDDVDSGDNNAGEGTSTGGGGVGGGGGDVQFILIFDALTMALVVRFARVCHCHFVFKSALLSLCIFCFFSITLDYVLLSE